MKLTDKAVQSIEKPGKGKRLVADEHRDAPRGFGLRINASGTKTFVLRYNAEGKDRLLTIGEYPTWTLAAARKKAGELRRTIDGGTDILKQRRAKRAEPTVAEMVDQFRKAQLDQLASGRAVHGTLERHLLPKLGHKKIPDVRRRDVVGLVEGVATCHPREAGKLLGYCKQLFAYAEDREIIEASPIANLKAQKIGKGLTATRRGRVLSSDEIRALWARAETCGIHRLTALALKLILVTAQRPGEVCGMRWKEIDGGQWIIPASRRGKTNDANVVPLTETALDLLGAAKEEVERLSARYPRTGGYVFEARPGKPVTTNSMARAVSRYTDALANQKVEPWGHWRAHDLRRTARTGLSAARVDDVVAELTIGHTRKGIAAVYDLHRYDAEKRAALEAWERRLLRIVRNERADDNVVPIGVAAID